MAHYNDCLEFIFRKLEVSYTVSPTTDVSSVDLFPQVLEDAVAGDDAAEDEAEQGANHDRRDHPGTES